jgi:hypothetical protein
MTHDQPMNSRSAHPTNAERQEVEFTFDELALIHKSLQAVRTLAVLPQNGELLDDTIQRVDQALNTAAGV